MTLLQARLVPSRMMGSGNEDTTNRNDDTDSDAAPFTLPHPGRCSGQKTLTIVITDDSGSVAGLGGNDSISKRYQEATIAFRHIANACTCGQEMGAVVHFDTIKLFDVPPTRLVGHGMRRIARGLTKPRFVVGTSDLGPSLQVAHTMADRFTSGRVQLVVFSDFMLSDANPQGVLADLGAFPGSVHAVVLTAAADQQLVDMEQVTVTEVSADSEPGAVARALFNGLAEHRIGAATA